MASSTDLPTCSIMSRKRYKDIEEYIRSLVPHADADKIMQRICDVMRFDPAVGMVTPKRKHNMRTRIERIASEYGVSTSIATKGIKACQELKKLKEICE